MPVAVAAKAASRLPRDTVRRGLTHGEHATLPGGELSQPVGNGDARIHTHTVCLPDP